MGNFDFFQTNNRLDVVNNRALPMQMAFMKRPELVDKYAWRLVSPNKNRLTRQIAESEEGYFVLLDQNTEKPLQTCFLISNDHFQQVVHNIIVVKSGVRAEIDTRCESRDCRDAAHISLTEIFVEAGAELSFTMRHCWEASSTVQPMMLVQLAENTKFRHRYFCQNAPRSLISNPTVHLVGKNAKFISEASLIAESGSRIDLGGRAIMSGDGQSAQLISKVVSRGGQVIARGEIIAKGASKGHIDCDGLMLTSGGYISSVPLIKDMSAQAELSHEASIGKLNPDQVEYLMTRGLTRDQAVELLVSGFLT